MRSFKKFTGIAFALLVLAMPAFAQTSAGRLVGTVTDPGGAVIPNATITVKDNQTGRERTAQASDQGAYDISQIEVGTYTVTITAQGFKTFVANELKIDTGRDYTLNATLEAGAVTETVTVVAGADIVNSTGAELSNTISPRQVRELPINGRNPLALLNLLPGVNPTSASINGQRSSVTNYTRDGMNVQDNFIRVGGFVQDRPTVDDTGEFTVITQNAGAEYGGSQNVQLVTPRGGSDFHGNVYEFNRNSYFGANRFFNNFNSINKPFLNRNQFGGTINGPSILPKFGEGGASILRGHAFFFANYEGFRQASQAPATATTLLPQARNGTFTYVDAGGTTRTVNVLSGSGLNLGGTNGAAFTTSGGPLSVDPLIQSRILSQLPSAGNGITTGINLLQVINYNIATPVTRNAVTGRFDVQVNDRHSFNFVYKRTNEDNARNDFAFGFQTTPFVFQGGPTTLYVGAYNMAPTPNFTNEFRMGYQRSEPFFNESGVPSDFLLGLPLITNPEGSFRNQGRNTDYTNFQDNATYTWGTHSLRFGGQLQKYQIEAINAAGTTPTFNISGTANPNTPGLIAGQFPGGIGTQDLARANSLRYLLAGIVGSGSVTANLINPTVGFVPGAASIRTLQFDNWSGYVQDQWRVSPRLTLNFGVRYELYTPLNNPENVYLEARVAEGQTPQQAALDPNGVYQVVGGNAGNPGDFFKADRNNFGPTVSFAWSPNFRNNLLGSLFPGEGRTVLRGGYRASFNNNEYVRSPDNANLNHVGFGSATSNVTTNIGGTETTSLRSILTPRAEAPTFQALPPNFTTPTVPTLPRPFSTNNTAAIANRFGSVFVIDPNFQLPRVDEYNIGIQREIGWQSAVEIRYVGSRSNQLVRSIDYNQIDIRNNGFLTDFLRAQNNCRLQGATLPGTGDPLFRCTDARFNANINGSQQTPIFNALGSAGLLNNATVVGQLQNGTPADLALIYIQNGLTGVAANGTGGVRFLNNLNTGVANVLENGGRFRYNSLQAEIRRRFVNGFSYQVNYTFQKTLADTTQDSQTNVDPFLDILNPGLNYARPDYDRAHTINANSNWELPFGRGRRWFQEGPLNYILGGFQLTNIVNISSGQPTSIRDPRGTLNRAGRSALQPATSTLTGDEIKELVGVYRTPNGIFYINPSVLRATATNPATNETRVVDLTQPLPAGFTRSSLVIRGAAPLGQAPFPGQVFFRNAPGSTGNTQINFINGPIYFNWNAGLFRNFKMGENGRNLQLRMEVFNVTNRANFNIGESSGIFNVNSDTFGRISGTFDPRIIQFGARFDF